MKTITIFLIMILFQFSLETETRILMMTFSNTNCTYNPEWTHTYTESTEFKGQDGKEYKIVAGKTKEWAWQQCTGTTCKTVLEINPYECNKISQITALSSDNFGAWLGSTFELASSANQFSFVLLSLILLLIFFF
ncbi:hypothetical protein M0811_01812 [Anaeramoeba ignava]|uniref:Uncharacterized protein n=1 Tax=Anaeramoeba ignava TaxID=1746090 RepID=A0A9Q0LDR6_ANAIG|nr:hypothetical protein M0811_01812 [Anaeramoeba ignava]